MTPTGLYEWPDELVYFTDQRVLGSPFTCAKLIGGVMGSVECRGQAPVGGIHGFLDPADAYDYVGRAPITPADLVYPHAGDVIDANVYAADFDPSPDYVAVSFVRIIMTGPSGYYTTCLTPAHYTTLTPGGCGGFTGGTYAETISLPSGIGTIVGQTVLPPSEIAYDDSDEGAELWPYASLEDAAIDFSYHDGFVGDFRVYWKIRLRLFWEIEPVAGGSITAGSVGRGVRRRVAVATSS